MSFPGEISNDAKETLPETSKKESYAGSVEEDAGKEGIGGVNSSERKRCTLDPCKEEDEDEARKKKTKKKKKRCAYDPCKTKLGLTAYPCRCARCGMWVDVGWINIIYVLVVRIRMMMMVVMMTMIMTAMARVFCSLHTRGQRTDSQKVKNAPHIFSSGDTLCRNNRRLIGTPLIVIARQS